MTVFQQHSVVAVVPARGGSKGVPLKNIRPLLGRPLVAHVGELVQRLPWLDRAVVSTDHPEIATAAEAAGLSVPFHRPPELSGDRIGDWEILAHALAAVEQIDGRTYDVVVMLQPTSPLRTPEHVTATVRKLVEEKWDAVWTVSPTDLKYHPLKQLCVGEDGAMRLHDRQGSSIVARQQLTPTFYRNGAAYAFSRRCILEMRTIIPERLSAVVVTEPMISIDDERDFRRVARRMAAAACREEAGDE
jgi:CMP-N,N'-diacetyllegionaminic acid synthase